MTKILTNTDKIKKIDVPLNLVIATSDTAIASGFMGLVGILKGIKAKIPAVTSSHTITFTLSDEDGVTVYSKASIPGNTNTFAFIDANNQPLVIPLAGQYKITLTFSGSEAANRVCIASLYIED